MELSAQLKASAEEKPTVSTAAVEKKQQLVSQSIPTPPVVDESQDASGIKPFEPTEESDAEADKTAHRTELKTIQTPSVESVSGSATRRFEQNQNTKPESKPISSRIGPSIQVVKKKQPWKIRRLSSYQLYMAYPSERREVCSAVVSVTIMPQRLAEQKAGEQSEVKRMAVSTSSIGYQTPKKQQHNSLDVGRTQRPLDIQERRLQTIIIPPQPVELFPKPPAEVPGNNKQGEQKTIHSETRKFLLPYCWTLKAIFKLINIFWDTMKKHQFKVKQDNPQFSKLKVSVLEFQTWFNQEVQQFNSNSDRPLHHRFVGKIAKERIDPLIDAIRQIMK